MVLGSGNNAEVLQKVITHLDDSDIDFFIHWDLKYKAPKLKAHNSHIIFIPRMKVYWGTSTQVYAEQKLLKSVWKSKKTYDYVHLISSSDIPLMTKEYFKTFFSKELYLGYSPESEKNNQRLSFYYPIDHLNIRKYHGLIRLIKLLNIVFRVNRLKGRDISPMKGPNWFSIRSTFVPIILNYCNMDIFRHTFLSDETYLQTILSDYRPQNLMEYNDNEMAARYIDWQRGQPNVFTIKDAPELKNKINTKYAFARKVKNPDLVDKIFSDM